MSNFLRYTEKSHAWATRAPLGARATHAAMPHLPVPPPCRSTAHFSDRTALVCPSWLPSGPRGRLLHCRKLAISSLEQVRLQCSASLCTPLALPWREGVEMLRCSASLDTRRMVIPGATSHREAA